MYLVEQCSKKNTSNLKLITSNVGHLRFYIPTCIHIGQAFLHCIPDCPISRPYLAHIYRVIAGSIRVQPSYSLTVPNGNH